MRLLFCGDVVGRSGRDAIAAHLPELRRRLDLDFVVVNAENAAAGFGITLTICRGLFAAGADVITTGNHVWDQREIIGEIDREPRLLRPVNYPTGTPGRGWGLFEAGGGRKVLVINAMGRLFMDPLDDPFVAVDALLKAHPLGAPGGATAILVDLHAEATSEKMAMGHFIDGRASISVGTHTHVPTADHMILPGGTAYQTDAGMCGDYDSVIGMKKEPPVARFVRKMPSERLGPADGEATLCGLFCETDDATGKARRVAPVRVGGVLATEIPSLETGTDAAA